MIYGCTSASHMSTSESSFSRVFTLIVSIKQTSGHTQGQVGTPRSLDNLLQIHEVYHPSFPSGGVPSAVINRIRLLHTFGHCRSLCRNFSAYGRKENTSWASILFHLDFALRVSARST